MLSLTADLNVTERELGVYFHWPYCTVICPYCDFNVYRERGHDSQPLLEMMQADLAWHREQLGARPLTSLFFGGGTPSLLSAAGLSGLIERCDELFGFAPNIEITLEANPTDVEMVRFADFSSIGVNRLSLGIQALDDTSLNRLGRTHSADDGRRAIEIATRCFDRVSLDLIYARPEQSAEAWERELTEAIAFGTQHISPYQLTIEKGTAFERAVARGAFVVPNAEHAADLYELTQVILEQAGFESYEVSNHAKSPKAQSVHNQLYWRSQDWMGIGPGAHGRIPLGNHARVATEALRRPEAYLKAVKTFGHGLDVNEALTVAACKEEFWLMGLRMSQGVSRKDARQRNTDLADSCFEGLASEGLMEVSHDVAKLTARGRLLTNSVVRALLI